jgi:hypothetical protein
LLALRLAVDRNRGGRRSSAFPSTSSPRGSSCAFLCAERFIPIELGASSSTNSGSTATGDVISPPAAGRSNADAGAASLPRNASLDTVCAYAGFATTLGVADPFGSGGRAGFGAERAAFGALLALRLAVGCKRGRRRPSAFPSTTSPRGSSCAFLGAERFLPGVAPEFICHGGNVAASRPATVVDECSALVDADCVARAPARSPNVGAAGGRRPCSVPHGPPSEGCPSWSDTVSPSALGASVGDSYAFSAGVLDAAPSSALGAEVDDSSVFSVGVSDTVSPSSLGASVGDSYAFSAGVSAAAHSSALGATAPDSSAFVPPELDSSVVGRSRAAAAHGQLVASCSLAPFGASGIVE